MTHYHYHYLTIEQRERLDAEIRTRVDTLRGDIAQALRQSGRPEAISLANHLEETDDAPVADLESALEIAALEREERELREMEAALERLHTPDFGVCAACGVDIPYVRLEVAPSATRCVACQSQLERTQGTIRAATL